MRNPQRLARQGHRLIQLGVLLLLVVCFEGFVVQALASPALGRSFHSLVALLGVLMLVFGVVWPRLELADAAARAAFWLLVYSGLAIAAAFLLGALWGAGQETMPIAAAGQHGTGVQEQIIKIVAYSSAPTGIIAFALILWGLRRLPSGM
jgi:hydroxylaminobenzene mutase